MLAPDFVTHFVSSAAYRRYAHTNSTKSAHEESEHEEQHHSAAYRLFRNIGQAASVETLGGYGHT